MARLIPIALAFLVSTPAVAEVEVSENGFATTNSVTVAAAPYDVWAVLIDPSRYWNPDHSFSGDGANFSLDPHAGGCFCETLPQGGSVEHMRVIMVQPNQLLRLSGALGPLQAEGLSATMSWQLEAIEGGTRVTQTYVVGGHMRFEREALAPAVDGVVREQLERLASAFAPTD